jgi:hypothetical protein
MGKMKLLAAAAALALLPAVARAEVKINEFQFDAPGTNPDKRFFEFKSSTGGVEGLSGLTLLAIDGDGGAAGDVDFIHSFGATDATGANGLALLRDGATVMSPPPAVGTTVITDAYTYNENTTVTYLLVNGYTGGAVGTDLDADNNGVLDSTPWTSVLSAYAFTDAAADKLYAAALGGTQYDEATVGGDLGGVVVLPDGTPVGIFTAGDNATGYTVVRSTSPLPANYALTPGGDNPAVPEPAAMSLIALAAVALTGGRRGRRR